MQLKITPKCVYEVDYSDLEVLVNELFGTDWSFVINEEARNDSNHTFNVIKNSELGSNEYDRFDFKDFLTENIISTRLLLNVLCNQDLIEEGDYLITVSW
jgi:hypothetical protein